MFVEDSKVALLKELVDKSGAQLVLSSTWRFGAFPECNFLEEELKALKEKLAEFGLTILDVTPVSHDGYRGKEIDEWLKINSSMVIESFIILDDDTDMKPWGSRLVQTSKGEGLKPNHVRRALKLLKEKVEIK